MRRSLLLMLLLLLNACGDPAVEPAREEAPVVAREEAPGELAPSPAEDDEIGSTFGSGGLGTTGVGEGGGREEGPGLGNIGQLGHGGGFGVGEGGGARRVLSEVRLARPTVVRGALAAEVVQRINRRHMNELRFCYDAARVTQPELAGSITIAFTVGETGAVIAAQARDSTLGSEPLATCLVTALRRWTYPAPESGTVEVTQAATFAPPPSEAAIE